MSLLKFYEYLSQVETFIENNEMDALKNILYDMHAADIAEVIDNLEEAEQLLVFKLLCDEKASEVLEELNSEQFTSILRDLTIERRVSLLENMSQDEIVDKLSELNENEQQEIFSILDSEDVNDVKQQLIYEDGTAGRLMTSEFVAIKKKHTVYYAIETLRSTAPDAETIYYIYVVDDNERLVGVVSLRELIIAPTHKLIEQIMKETIISVNVHDDQEHVAKVVSKYSLLAVPVVDDLNRLHGIITVDDVLDVVEEEATEDIFKFAGTSETEVYETDTSLIKRVRNSVKSRLPWLIITIFGGLLSANVLSHYQGQISANATLAMFMPLLTGMGGNVGTQSSTITVRNIATHDIKGSQIFKTLIHEISVGLLVGLVCSALVGLFAVIMNAEYHIAFIVGIAMWANMTTAATIGTIVPLFFKKIGIDPAVASAPFITTTIDLTGLSIYFSLATILLTHL